ncbi:MAG: hypothetical protein MI976_08595 [Pseudomonadales bacterium]|nr:hypothetical protein [Pseudomonadales bacterium]
MKKLGILNLLVVGCVFSINASAAIITVDWSGIISATSFTDSISVGDTVTGRFIYDDSSASISKTPISSQLLYDHRGFPIGGASYDTNHKSTFSINGYTGFTTGNLIDLDNGSQLDRMDSITGSSSVGFGDTIEGFAVHEMSLRFLAPGVQAIDGFDLEQDWSEGTFVGYNPVMSSISFSDGSSSRSFQFNINGVSYEVANEVSEPATIMLFLLCLIVLGLNQTKRLRANKLLV